MNKNVYVAAVCAIIASAPSAVFATPILGNTSVAQLIGTIAANQAYTVSASGTVALCGSCNGGGSLLFNPDGTVANTAVGAYTPFNSGPQDHDPSSGPTAYGYYGAGIYFGALYGTFSLTPTASDLFLIGYGTTISASNSARTLYGVVNDCCYFDNPASPAFNVTLNRATVSASVPEPATWGMMVGGFAMIGGAMRRRRTSVRFA